MSSDFFYPDDIADPSLNEAELMACEVPCKEEPPLCEGVGFCDGDGCVGCTATWSCFPVKPWLTWDQMSEEEKEYIRVCYPAFVGV